VAGFRATQFVQGSGSQFTGGTIYFEIVEDQTVIVRILHSRREIRRIGFNEEG
jgi:plasmid stabilization system protein ParE